MEGNLNDNLRTGWISWKVGMYLKQQYCQIQSDMCVTFHLRLFLVYICLATTDTKASLIKDKFCSAWFLRIGSLTYIPIIKCSIRVFIFIYAMFLLRIYANFPELNLKAPLLEDLEVEMKVSNFTHFCVCAFLSVYTCIYTNVRIFARIYDSWLHWSMYVLCSVDPTIHLPVVYLNVYIYIYIYMQMQELKRQHMLDRQQVI